jgi:hypothetical protein
MQRFGGGRGLKGLVYGFDPVPASDLDTDFLLNIIRGEEAWIRVRGFIWLQIQVNNYV